MADESSLSRMDRLVQLLGGDENLPPKFEPPATEPESESEPAQSDNVNIEGVPGIDAAIEKLQSIDSFVQEQKEQPGNWWDAVPQLPKQTSQTQTQPVHPYLSDGSVHFNFDSRKGEPAPLGLGFCPFTAVTKFCYKFVKREFQQPIATAFFDEGKIWNREWDL